MSNGYFRLVNTQNGFGLSLVRARDGGQEVRGMDVTAYLDALKLDYDLAALKAALESTEDVTVELGTGACPAVNETYTLNISRDKMLVTLQFQAPSPTGKRVEISEVLNDLKVKKIGHGIQTQNIQEHFSSEGIYDREIVAVKGTAPRHGSDAWIEYFFKTDMRIQPTVREDGTVDYFQLNMINHCKAGDVLAMVHPADPGNMGMDVYGNWIKPKDVKQETLKFGQNIQLSEDHMKITSMVDGHVMLVDDKVFVSNIYEVENVDLSTGNIEFTGSVQVNGNVKENMHIIAGGNVIVNGVVEGAYIEAAGNIVIARGMNGMTKGSLKAGGNIICKFLENTSAYAEGYVNTESILYSNVSAGTEIIVTGKKGFITGGHVQAGKLISVKNLGANMGAVTVVEVGVNPAMKMRFLKLQQEIAEIVKVIRNAQPVLVNFAEKRAKGARITPDQMKYVAEMDKLIKEKSLELNQKNAEMKELQESYESNKDAKIDVQGIVCAGTTIIVGDLSVVLKSEFHYCRFVEDGGEIRALPL